MKNAIALIGFLGLLACETNNNTYTGSKYFDCTGNGFKQNSDRQKLIYALLEKALVLDKEKLVNSLMKDKKKIYICKTYYSKFSGATKADIREYQFEENDIPFKINDVRFCLKSPEQLQKIADSTTGFVYFTLGEIEITGDIATIGISGGWQNQTTTKLLGIGEGYTWQFKKTNGNWVFDKSLKSWIA